jgi:putative peptidoglycan lipid II flippase
VFGHAYGASGVAASISLGAWCCAAILGWRGASTFGFSIDVIARRRLPRIAICAAVMGAMLLLAESFVAPVAVNAGFAANLTILGGLVAAGVSFYGLLLDLFGVINWGEAISNLRDGRLRE